MRNTNSSKYFLNFVILLNILNILLINTRTIIFNIYQNTGNQIRLFALI